MPDFLVRIKAIIQQHCDILLLFPASLLAFFVYPNLNKYVFYFMVFITVLYCINICAGKFAFSKKFFKIFGAVLIVSLYTSIAFWYFYPQSLTPQKKVSVSSLSAGWDFYNAQALAFKKLRLSLPIKPSEKLKKLDNPYDRQKLNENLSFMKGDFVLDLSYYKEKYYIYFGITPVLLLYLPFLIITGKFILDSAAVLLFSILAFLSAFIFLNKLLERFNINKSFVFNILTVLCLGICCGCPFIISTPRVYEAAVICASFLGLLSYLFLLFYLKNKEKTRFLFLSGLCAALAVGARPFYVFVILTQIFVFVDFKRLFSKEELGKYAYYFIPVLIYGFLLALYNFLRFDNPFEFGFKYGLFIEALNTPIEYLFEYIRKFLFLKPAFFQGFPYTGFNLVAIQKTLGEPYIGIFWLIPALFLLVFGISYFKSRSVLEDNKKLAASMLISCAIIIIVESQVSLVYRYIADVAFYLIICSLLFSASLLESLKGVKLNIMRFAVIFLMFLSVVFSCAAFVSYNCLYGFNQGKSIGFFRQII
jgi:hypothetical protein